MKKRELSRREFVKVGTTGTAAAFLLRGRSMLGADEAMPERQLGKTGHQVRLFSLGGEATIKKPGARDEAHAIINRAIDLGVNYIDTAANYGDGTSETHIGEIMTTRRKEVFLSTKTHDRTRDGSLRLLEKSLNALQTDYLDGWQLHNIMTDDDLDQIFGKGGALEAIQKARDEKTVRYLGITGHWEPTVLTRAIKRFDFDTILMALNPSDPHFNSFLDELLPTAEQKNMGVIAMKVLARGRLFRPGGLTSRKDAMNWVWSHPVNTMIVGCDTVSQLEENVKIAADFKPLSAAETAHIEGLTESYCKEGSFFKKGGAGWNRASVDTQGFAIPAD
jgi:aryl-alcohol dehydrogenase-like predicted oxidoreductase